MKRLLVPWLLCLAVGCGDDDEPSRAEESERPSVAPDEPPQERTVAPAGDPVPEPRDAIALGAAHSCRLSRDGAVRCWGSHQFGQLGTSTIATGPGAHSVSAVGVEGVADAVALGAGRFHTCAIRRGGELSCWGHGGFGQLGDGGTDDRTAPVEVTLEETVVAVAAGEGHTCARLASRRVQCWGRNTLGQLGRAGDEARATPAPVQGLDDVVQLGAGRDHTCALRADGTVWCWGAGFEGQLGLGDGQRPEARPTPARVTGIDGAVAIGIGSAHGCAVMEGGAVRCWGRNDSGQVGDGLGGEPENVTSGPAVVAGLDGVVELVAGARHSCARLASGAVRCWGYNGFGQLGDGTDALRSAPTTVEGLADVLSLSAGVRHTCALSRDGSVSCWGRNHAGQVGDPSLEDRLVPTPLQAETPLEE